MLKLKESELPVELHNEVDLARMRDEPDSVSFGAWAVGSLAVEVTAVYTDKEDRNFLIARVWRKHDSPHWEAWDMYGSEQLTPPCETHREALRSAVSYWRTAYYGQHYGGLE